MQGWPPAMCLDRFSSIHLVSGSWNRPKISRDTVGEIQGKVGEALNWSFMESEGLSTTGIWNVDMKLQYLLHFLVTKKSRFYKRIVIHVDHALKISSQLRRSLHPLREPGLVAKLPSCKMFHIEQHEQNIKIVSRSFVIKRNVEKDVDTCHSPPRKEDYTRKLIEILMHYNKLR